MASPLFCAKCIALEGINVITAEPNQEPKPTGRKGDPPSAGVERVSERKQKCMLNTQRVTHCLSGGVRWPVYVVFIG